MTFCNKKRRNIGFENIYYPITKAMFVDADDVCEQVALI